MGTWTNNDGLYIKYGVTAGETTRGGELKTYGDLREIEFELQLEDVPAVSAPLILGDNVFIPDNAQIDEVEITVEEVTAGTNANLDLGLVKQDRTTAIDLNGLIAAGDGWHEAAIGTKLLYQVGTTEAGAILGTIITDPGLICANYDTAAFTAGVLRIIIRWHAPVSPT